MKHPTAEPRLSQWPRCFGKALPAPICLQPPSTRKHRRSEMFTSHSWSRAPRSTLTPAHARRTLAAALLSGGDARPAVTTQLCSQDPAQGSALCTQVCTRARCMGKHCTGVCTPTPCTLQACPCRGPVCAHTCSVWVMGPCPAQVHTCVQERHVAVHAHRVAAHACAQRQERGDTWKRLQNLLPLGRPVHCSHRAPLVQPAGAGGEDAKKSGCQSVRVPLPCRSTRVHGEDAGSPVHPAGPKQPRGRQPPGAAAKGMRGLSPHLPRCHLRSPAPRTRSRSRTGWWPRRLLPGNPRPPARCRPLAPAPLHPPRDSRHRLRALTGVPRPRRLPERPTPALRAPPHGRPEATGTSTAETRGPKPLPGPGGAAPGAGAGAAAASELPLPPASRRRRRL